MKSMDINNFNNDRGFVLEKLMAICDALALSYEYNEKTFTVKLPTIEEMPIIAENMRRKSFDISKWGDTGVDETMPDELPPAEYNLEEGQPPKEPEE